MAGYITISKLTSISWDKSHQNHRIRLPSQIIHIPHNILGLFPCYANPDNSKVPRYPNIFAWPNTSCYSTQRVKSCNQFSHLQCLFPISMSDQNRIPTAHVNVCIYKSETRNALAKTQVTKGKKRPPQDCRVKSAVKFRKVGYQTKRPPAGYGEKEKRRRMMQGSDRSTNQSQPRILLKNLPQKFMTLFTIPTPILLSQEALLLQPTRHIPQHLPHNLLHICALKLLLRVFLGAPYAMILAARACPGVIGMPFGAEDVVGNEFEHVVVDEDDGRFDVAGGVG